MRGITGHKAHTDIKADSEGSMTSKEMIRYSSTEEEIALCWNT